MSYKKIKLLFCVVVVVVVVHRNHRSGKSARAVVKSYQKTELLLLLFLGTVG